MRKGAAMSTYHLHARLLEGPLAAPERDEVRVSETDSWDDAQAWARAQLVHGFTVWIYDHGHVTPIAGACDYRMIAHSQPTRTASTRPTLLPRRRPPRETTAPRANRPPDPRRVQ